MYRPSTQQFLEISDIREGIVILKNHSFRAILMVSSVNFDLKSEEEQRAIIFQFQTFLNSLDFSAQIVIRSRRLNITGYFDKLKELELKQKNELLKTQVSEYRKFVENLVKEGVIMKKEFYLVVPFSLSEGMGGQIEKKNRLLSIKKSFSTKITEDAFRRAKEQLWQRMEFVAVGLRRCGLNSMPLTTPELIELFWSWYHPKEAEKGYYPEIIPELLKESKA